MDDSSPAKPGVVPCLRCQKPFDSPDRTRIRICHRCKTEGRTHGLRDISTRKIREAIGD